MLSNAYFLAKFRFGTAENERAKNLQIVFHASTVTGPQVHEAALGRARRRRQRVHHAERAGPRRGGGPPGLAADFGVKIFQFSF